MSDNKETVTVRLPGCGCLFYALALYGLLVLVGCVH